MGWEFMRRSGGGCDRKRGGELTRDLAFTPNDHIDILLRRPALESARNVLQENSSFQRRTSPFWLDTQST